MSWHGYYFLVVEPGASSADIRKNTHSPEISLILRLTNLNTLDISQQKRALRQQMRQRRGQLEPIAKAAYDNWVCEQVWQRIEQKAMQSVHCYLPMGTEIDIYPLIQRMLAAGIRVVNPKTLPKHQLEHLILESLDRLEKGVFGTTFPATGKEYRGSYDLILVPGLAFNEQGMRLGYGGGYYDNFLVQHPGALKMGIFYPFQKVEDLPVEDHDFPLDEVLFRDFPEKDR